MTLSGGPTSVYQPRLCSVTLFDERVSVCRPAGWWSGLCNDTFLLVVERTGFRFVQSHFFQHQKGLFRNATFFLKQKNPVQPHTTCRVRRWLY